MTAHTLPGISALPAPYFDDGTVRIYHGDAAELLPLIDPTAFAVMVTDPPYGIEYRSGHLGTAWWHSRNIAGDGDTALRDAALAWWSPRPALVFGSWRAPRPAATRMVLVWDKGGALGMGALDLPWKPGHEEVYVIGEGFSGRRDSDVICEPPVQAMAKNGRVHPTEKPVRLMSKLLAKSPAGAVIDPFCGSGPTLRAAKDAGRPAVGIELDQRHCETAARRLAQSVLPLAEVRS